VNTAPAAVTATLWLNPAAMATTRLWKGCRRCGVREALALAGAGDGDGARLGPAEVCGDVGLGRLLSVLLKLADGVVNGLDRALPAPFPLPLPAGSGDPATCPAPPWSSADADSENAGESLVSWFADPDPSIAGGSGCARASHAHRTKAGRPTAWSGMVNLSENCPKRPLLPRPQEYTSPASERHRVWWAPHATASAQPKGGAKTGN